MATCGHFAVSSADDETLLAFLSKITHFEACYFYLQRGKWAFLSKDMYQNMGAVPGIAADLLEWTEKVLQLKKKAMLTLAKFELALDKIHH